MHNNLLSLTFVKDKKKYLKNISVIFFLITNKLINWKIDTIMRRKFELKNAKNDK